MRYIIIGAGGIGGAIGGRLADAGHRVVLVARGESAKVIKRDGLRLAIPERVIMVRPEVVESVGDLALDADDVLILCVKSQDTQPLLPELAVLDVAGRPAGEVLPLFCAQNGTSNEPAALRYFRHVHGISLMLQATYLIPGRVSASGSPYTGVLELGRYPSGFDEVDERVAADLNACGMCVEVRQDVMAWKRAKLLRNLRNALEAMCGSDMTGEAAAAYERLRSAAIAEGRACFEAAGQAVVSPEEWEARTGPELNRNLPVEGQGRMGGSTWQSLTRGQPTVETDFLNGDIVQLGRQLGIPTPVNERIQQAIWKFVRQRRAAGSLEPGDLEAA